MYVGRARGPSGFGSALAGLGWDSELVRVGGIPPLWGFSRTPLKIEERRGGNGTICREVVQWSVLLVLLVPMDRRRRRLDNTSQRARAT